MYVHTAGDGKGYALHIHTAYCGKGDKTKAQTFRYRSLLSEQKQNVSICSNVFLKSKNETRMKPSLFIIGLKRFHTPMLQRNQTRTFVFKKKLYQNETKTFQIAPGFFKDKTKLLLVP